MTMRGSAEASAREIRKQRAKRLLLRVTLWVVLPTLLSGVYYGCYATPQYESISTLSVYSGDRMGYLGSLASLIPASSSSRDTMLVSEYMRSRDMLAILVRDQGFVEHYQAEDADWWSRLHDDANSEEIYEHFLDHVQVGHSSHSGTLTLRVRAYSAERAQAFARAIARASEEMVNRLRLRAHRDAVQTAQEEVDAAQTRLAKAREALLAAQAEEAELDPTAAASSALSIRTTLEAELAKTKADLDAATAVMHDQAPKVLELRQRVRSLQGQINRQNRRLAGGSGDGISADIARFEPLVIEKEFAQSAYETALTALEVARVESVRQQRYLVTISEPSLPDVASYPRRAWGVATVFALSLTLMIIGSLLFAAVREHAKL